MTTHFRSLNIMLGVSVLCALLCLTSRTIRAQDAAKTAATKTVNDAATEALVPGFWRGKLKTGGPVLTLVLQFERKTDGTLQGWLHSLDQNALGTSVKNIRIGKGTLAFDVPNIGGSFEGVLQGEGGDDRRLAGTWKQGAPLPLEMQPVADVPEIARPQEPTRPFPYREQEITVASGDVALQGTLTLPPADGDKKFPAIVLVQEGAPGEQHDRDSRQWHHRPFLIVSDWLTRQGFATLRLDARSAAEPGTITYDQRSDDLKAAVKFLQARPEIDGARTGLLGWGEGGNIASRVASENGGAAFLVLMSPLGVNGAELMTLQALSVIEAKDYARAQIEALTTIFDILETEDNAVKREMQLRQAVEKALRGTLFGGARELKPEQQTMLSGIVDRQLKTLMSPSFRDFISHDPRQTLARVQVPVLAISGQFNTLIPTRENLAAIRAALQKGGNKDATIQELPGLNYQFQPSEAGKMEEFAKTKETIAPKVLELLNTWLQKRMAAK